MATWGTPLSLRGSKGDPGLSILNGSGAPAAGLGVDTQLYFDTSGTGDVYQRSNGTWSKVYNLVGPMGLNGINGSFFTGVGAPTSSTYSGTGQAIYISTTGEVFTYTSQSTGWVDSGENLTGPQGPQGAATRGSQIFTGSGAPSSNLSSFSNGTVSGAVPGDLYFDTATTGGPFMYVLGT
jgi:hypothetical protein